MRILLSASLFFFLLAAASAQTGPPDASADSDHDGLTDAIETALLTQFAPRFMVSAEDCSSRPAEFVPFLSSPQVKKENGTIYGQAFPLKDHAGQVELHYYHLWRRDCGEMSHALDAEHVSALVARDETSQWTALYWYTAAHENTVCDASQIARATTVDAELHGPTVWISRGKHASFLSAGICSRGCGGDTCRNLQALPVAQVINLGERLDPMNGANWAGSPQWPLAEKMSRSDFPINRTARVDRLALTTIAWANPVNRPMQAAIQNGNSALGGTSAGLHAADTAVDVATSDTGDALGAASGSTGRSLAKALRGVKKALGATARKLGAVD